MTQPPRPNFPIYFDGRTYEPDQDEARLRTQLWRVFEAMADGHEHTLAELAGRTGGSEAAVSARLRDLRKERFGSWLVERRRIEGGLFAYRLRHRPEPVVPTLPEGPLEQQSLF